MECDRCLLTDDIAEIVGGTCEYCKMHDRLIEDSLKHKPKFLKMIEKIKKRKGFQVLMGISGGLDSSYLLVWAVKMGLRPLVVHFDNGYNTPEAEANMARIVKELGVTLIRYSLPQQEYSELNHAFKVAKVSDADIPNDMAMSAIMMDLADKYKIKYVLNGHDFRNEGSCPLQWTYMDAKYLNSIYRSYTHKDLEHFPLLTFNKQLIYALKGIKQLRPYNYNPITDNNKLLVLKEYGFLEYGAKHAENHYTKEIAYNYLPRMFGINKSILYLSARVRSGWITKNEGREMYKKPPRGVYVKLCAVKTYKDFDHYNFKRFKPLLWLLAKMRLIPYQFYKKYTS